MIDNALEILEKIYGYKSFRRGQEKIITSILEGNDILAIMPTGGGKSICYQVPALLLDGVTIVVSPLISLMKDQVDTLKAMDIACTYINSTLSTYEFNEAINGVMNNKYKLIYVAPERLESNEFLNAISSIKVSQIAIDEAHCVSQWGHDFRSSYRRIKGFINLLRERPIVTAFTATATEEVKTDIISLLGLNNPETFITGFDRENLRITIVKSGNKNDYLFSYLENNKGKSGIIYAATRKEVEKLYEVLTKFGYNVGKYHAGLTDDYRKEVQEDFINDKLDIMVATNAFGMGIDKPNIRYVIHYNMPQTIEGYYQEIGRAGRDGGESECILLFTPGDVHTQKYLIEVSTESEVRKTNGYKKLQQMVDLIYYNHCYKKYLLSYFGEEREADCNNCSNCLDNGEIIDKTIDAQKVLSCIYRMKRPFGTTMVIDVLRGSKNKKVTSLGFNELSTYGIMKNYSNDGLKDFINTLISHGFLDSVEGTYPVLRPNNQSLKVIKGEEKVLFRETKVEKKREEVNQLFNILREIRAEIASENKIAPYMVFGDGTLMEMSIKYPTTKEELLNISGVGEVKYNRYGENFINAIEDYVIDNNIKKEVGKVESTLGDKAIDMSEYPLEVETDINLYNKLIELRVKWAKKEKALPQMIISKNSLKEISGRYPKTEEELKDISGVGPKKVKDHGEEILNTVNNHLLEEGISKDFIIKKKRKVILDGETRDTHKITIDSLKEGKTLEEISEDLEVSISTLLGYLTDYIKESGDYDFDIDINKYITSSLEEEIFNKCNEQGIDKISLIKKQLPDGTKYEEIRAVILKRFYNFS